MSFRRHAQHPQCKIVNQDVVPDLKLIFKPYLALGNVCGLRWKKGVLSKLFCAFTFLFILFCIGRGISFQKYEKFSSKLVFRFLLLLYAMHCLVGFAMIIKIQINGELQDFIFEWAALRKLDDVNPPSYALLLKISKLGVWFTVGTSIINGVFVGLGSLGLGIKFPWIQSYLIFDELRVVNGFIVFFTSFSFCMSQMLYTLICMISLLENRHFFNNLTSIGMIDFIKQLPNNRRQFYKLTALIEAADKMLSKYAFAVYGFNTPTLIITAFLLVRDTAMPAASKFTFTVWLAVLFLQIGVVSVLPAALHYSIHRPITYLECAANLISTEYPSSPSSDSVFHQLSLFIMQLTTRNIGITGAGFFVITKRIILTIISLMLTYFAVILKLDLSSRAACQCVCQNNDTSTALPME